MQPDRWKVFAAFFFSFAIELTVYRLVKQLVKRPRPCHRLGGPLNLVEPQDFFSFPSGHTAGAFVIALSVTYCYPSLSIPIYFWATLIGFSRIYLGVHYPTDVLAGACLGVLSVIAGLLVGNYVIAWLFFLCFDGPQTFPILHALVINSK
jgi:undecaprenyl-diphosphatase